MTDAEWITQAKQVLVAVVDWDRYLTREEEPVIQAAGALIDERSGTKPSGTKCGFKDCPHLAKHDEDEDDYPSRCWFHATDTSRVIE